jgi:ribosomal protein S18 acetylase RimI-like enzyme
MRSDQRITQITHEPPIQLGNGLCQAFYDEPNFTYIFPDILVRRVALPWFLGRFVVQLGLNYGAVFTANEVDGAAVWLHPNTTIPLQGALRAGLLLMPFRFGWRSFRRSTSLGSYLERLRQQSAPTQHWYLMALGVAPSRQGAGLGRALVQSVLTRVDAEQVPCYLETFTERNVQFYEKLGFIGVVHDHIPGGGPPFWTMVRTPQT